MFSRWPRGGSGRAGESGRSREPGDAGWPAGSARAGSARSAGLSAAAAAREAPDLSQAQASMSRRGMRPHSRPSPSGCAQSKTCRRSQRWAVATHGYALQLLQGNENGGNSEVQEGYEDGYMGVHRMPIKLGKPHTCIYSS